MSCFQFCYDSFHSLGAVSHNYISFQLFCTLLVAGEVIVFLNVSSMENSNLAVVLKFKRPYKIHRGLLLHFRVLPICFLISKKNVGF